jgi:hypothetical protein
MHWTALHHLMGYLEGNPTFKLCYRRPGAGVEAAGSTGSPTPIGATGQQRISQISYWSDGKVQQNNCAMAVQDAEDHLPLHCTAEVKYYAASEMATVVIYQISSP